MWERIIPDIEGLDSHLSFPDIRTSGSPVSKLQDLTPILTSHDTLGLSWVLDLQIQITAVAFPPVDSTLWDFSASVITWANFHNKSLIL